MGTDAGCKLYLVHYHGTGIYHFDKTRAGAATVMAAMVKTKG